MRWTSWDATFRTGGQATRVPEDYRSIGDALRGVVRGGAVYVGPGEYHERVFVPSFVQLIGANPDRTVITASGDGPIVTVANNGHFEGFTVTGATGGENGAIYVQGAGGRVRRVRVIDNETHGVVVGCMRGCIGFVEDSIVARNQGTGITLLGAGQALRNTVADNDGGINPETSSQVVEANIVTRNRVGLFSEVFLLQELRFNMVWGNRVNYRGLPPGRSDMATEPLLLENYHLSPCSPAIDILRLADLPSDYDGQARPIDGDADGVAAADIGADEHDPISGLCRAEPTATVVPTDGPGPTVTATHTPPSPGYTLTLPWAVAGG
jgi:hypothetical protein